MTATTENGPFTLHAAVPRFDDRDCLTGWSYPKVNAYFYETAELPLRIAARLEGYEQECGGDGGYEVRDRNGKRVWWKRPTEAQSAINWAAITDDEIPF